MPNSPTAPLRRCNTLCVSSHLTMHLPGPRSRRKNANVAKGRFEGSVVDMECKFIYGVLVSPYSFSRGYTRFDIRLCVPVKMPTVLSVPPQA